jgi:MiaB/RimO family radical SAM methylthiotransferase
LRSYPLEGILEDISIAVNKGSKEIRLTSQDTASYGMDIGEMCLPSLIDRCCQLDGKFRIRIGMMNPRTAARNFDQLIDSYRNEKVYKFLHLPVQSGSDEILKKMNRPYKARDFVRLIKKFRKEFPDSTIATDIIVAFPSETKEQFEESCSLIRETKPDVVNITRFSSRPGTKAKKMRQIDTKIVKDRSRIMTEIVDDVSYEKNISRIGKSYEVLLLEKKDGWTIGKAENYKSVFIKDEDNKYPIGDFLTVKIKDATTTHLIGETR